MIEIIIGDDELAQFQMWLPHISEPSYAQKVAELVKDILKDAGHYE